MNTNPKDTPFRETKRPGQLSTPHRTDEMKPKTDEYIVITPVRNEEAFIGITIESIIKQSRKPLQWIIVDDNSTDSTHEIIERYAKEHAWITPVRLERSGKRQSGGGVIRAFHYGFEKIEHPDRWSFIVKLDGDIRIDSDRYFEEILGEFKANPKLGIAGGMCYFMSDGVKHIEDNQMWHVRGPTKIYKRQCYTDIGGLLPVLGWDGIDVYSAMYHGWETRTFPEYEIEHFVQTGCKVEEGGDIYRFVKWGIGSYNIGLSPSYVILRSLYRARQKPYFIGAMIMLYHYSKMAIQRKPVHVSKEIKKFIRERNSEYIREKLRSLYSG